MRLVEEKFLGRDREILLQIVAETIGKRLENGEGLDVGLFLRRITCGRG